MAPKLSIEVSPPPPICVKDSQGHEVKVIDCVGGRGDKNWVYNFVTPVANLPKSEARVQCNLCQKSYACRNSSLAGVKAHLKVK